MKKFGYLIQWNVGKVFSLKNKFGVSREEAERGKIIKETELENQIYIVDTTCTVEEFMGSWLEEVKRPWLTGDFYNSYKNCVYRYIISQLGKLKMRMNIMTLYQTNVAEGNCIDLP